MCDDSVGGPIGMREEASMPPQTEARRIMSELVGRLAAQYAPDKVILFGSYAYGVPGPDSDIDLLIIKRTQAPFLERWRQVRRILSDPRRLLPIETLVLTPDELSDRLACGDRVLQGIIDRGEVLYAA